MPVVWQVAGRCQRGATRPKIRRETDELCFPAGIWKDLREQNAEGQMPNNDHIWNLAFAIRHLAFAAQPRVAFPLFPSFLLPVIEREESTLKEKVRHLPDKPGVYLMKDRLGRI